MPKIQLVEFLKSKMPELVKIGSPQAWNSLKAKKVQFPSLNITLLDQHYKKLEAVSQKLYSDIDLRWFRCKIKVWYNKINLT